LWSLLDIMRRFSAAAYTDAMSAIRALADVSIMWRGRKNAPRGLRGDMRDVLADKVKPQLDALPLTLPVRAMVDRVMERASDDNYTFHEASVSLDMLHDAIMADLSAPCFLYVPAEKGHFYDQPEPPFGQEVTDAFPVADRDIAAAGRCFALDEWTACVFHLMRVLEIGLHDLAAELLETDEVPAETWLDVLPTDVVYRREAGTMPAMPPCGRW